MGFSFEYILFSAALPALIVLFLFRASLVKSSLSKVFEIDGRNYLAFVFIFLLCCVCFVSFQLLQLQTTLRKIFVATNNARWSWEIFCCRILACIDNLGFFWQQVFVSPSNLRVVFFGACLDKFRCIWKDLFILVFFYVSYH